MPALAPLPAPTASAPLGLPLALLVMLVLSGCATTSGAGAARPEPGLDHLADSPPLTAAPAYETAAARARGSTRAELYLRAAEAWQAGGDTHAAERALSAVDGRRLATDDALRYDLLRAESELRDQAGERALQRLRGDPSRLPDPLRQRWHAARAEALLASDRPFEAAAELSRLAVGQTRTERAESLATIARLLARVDDDTLRHRADALAADDPLYRHVAAALSERGFAVPRPVPPDPAFDQIERAPADADGYRPARRLAVLLPLTGALASAAESVRDGLLSAHFGETRNRPDLRFYDTESSPERAVERYREAQRDGAGQVIGPLGRDEVAAVAALADLSLPLLALNRDERPLPPGHMSFSLAPEDEAIALADRLLRRGQRRTVAISDGDPVGERSLAAFAERLREAGGELLVSARIDPTFSNHSTAIGQIHAVVGTDGFDAVVLALQAPQARMVAAQLPAAGLVRRPIYATSRIVLGSGDPRLDRELDGIEFPDLAWPTRTVPGTPSGEGPAGQLDSARGGRARLFAFGIDAYRLSGYGGRLASDPSAVLRGATGELRLDLFGNVLREPAWSVFEGGRPQPASDGGLATETMAADVGR